ncbi:hypothetical protein OESDEN_10738 [Oesophagostomum dentatum]|uniref:Uncharacterized protein n=1 Tax=Oesophagostomum dentatum TaxID=61180 RepID=A0A0B1SZT3_OESDE|nr:hypothetical protein OESDEN_10738 [Oesophagostomum dentatum]
MKIMNCASLVVLLCSVYTSFSLDCKYTRFETNAEAERRAVFERCLMNCSESARGQNPCYNCMLPYENYGCLLKREELTGCETDCALQTSEENFMVCLQRCARKRRTLKKLRNFKILSDRERTTTD